MVNYSGVTSATSSTVQSAQHSGMTNPFAKTVAETAGKSTQREPLNNTIVNVNLVKPTPVQEIPTDAIKAKYFPQFNIAYPKMADPPLIMAYRD